jgi:hypothetical protein
MSKTQVRPSRDLRNIYDELQESKAKMSNPDAVLHDADNVHDELEQILEAHGL